MNRSAANAYKVKLFSDAALRTLHFAWLGAATVVVAGAKDVSATGGGGAILVISLFVTSTLSFSSNTTGGWLM
jgi:hypothetical protein